MPVSHPRWQGGGLEDHMVTHPFEMYELSRGHIAFNKFGKRKDTVRKVCTHPGPTWPPSSPSLSPYLALSSPLSRPHSCAHSGPL